MTNINPEDADGCTSIHYATNENQLPIIKYFVDNVDDINPASCDFYEDDTLIGNGYTPLHVAAYKGYLDIRDVDGISRSRNIPRNPGIKKSRD